MRLFTRARPGDGSWVKRLAWTAVGYGVLVVFLSLLGYSPSAVLIAAFAVAFFSVAVLVADRLPDVSGDRWPLLRASSVGVGRGSDHRTASLASRLSTMDTASTERRLALAASLQEEIRGIVAAHVRRHDTRDVVHDPSAARAVLPPKLAAVLTGPPDPRLVDPAFLSTILDQVETLA